MPRKKAVNGENESELMAIHGRITMAARSFAQEVLHILGSSTLAELTSVTRGGGFDGAAVGVATAPVRKVVNTRTIELKRLGGTRPVECPSPGCKQPGVRAKMNFCHEHARALPRAEKVRLRESQKNGLAQAAEAAITEKPRRGRPPGVKNAVKNAS